MNATKPKPLVDTMMGRRAPHNIDIEQALLACCILNPEECLGDLTEKKFSVEAFYKPSHQMIFDAMLALYNANKGIDEITLGDKLEELGQLDEIGGNGYIIEFTNRVDTESHHPHFRDRLLELHLLRQLIQVGVYATEQAYNPEGEVQEVVANVEQRIMAIQGDSVPDTVRQCAGAVNKAIDKINQYLVNRGAITGVKSGFIDLDKMTTGWQPGEMIIIAARPSMGKSAIGLNMCERAIFKDNLPTLFFSLEMPEDQLATRIICSHGRANMTKMKEGFLPKDKQLDVANASNELKAAPFYIDDSSDNNISMIRAKARRMKRKHNIGLIIIDYLQLVPPVNNRIPREQQVSEISRGCKAMAKELGLPVIVLAQINRDAEKEKRQPRMSDLRESGSIEQDADAVLMIAKPKDYNEEEDEANEVVHRELIIAKQRNGPVGRVPLHFTKALTRFENYTPHS